MDTDAFYKITQGLYVLGAQDNGKLSGSLVDAVMQVASQPLILAVSCHNGSQTLKDIEKSRAFSLSVLPQSVPPEVVANFGFYTSRKRDKWSYVPHDLYDGLPRLATRLAFFVCEVIQTIKFESNTLILGWAIEAQNNLDEAPATYQFYRSQLKPSVVAACRQDKEGCMTENKEKHWVCTVCGYVYDGEIPFEELPESWVCPICGVDKSHFVYE